MTTPSRAILPTLAAGVSSPDEADLIRQAKNACDRILDHAVQNDFSGSDPYDGLAAQLPAIGLLKKSRLGRLMLIQAVRRSRVNLRPLLRIPGLVNPKTLGLLMSTCCDLYQVTGEKEYSQLYHHMARRVRGLASLDWPEVCWGYPFDWQARAFYFPAGLPTVVCTSFVARGFLHGYRVFRDPRDRDVAISSARFMASCLNRLPEKRGITLSYSPIDHARIHNASALGASYLAEIAGLLGQPDFLDIASQAFKGLLSYQLKDGSWPYGTARHHRWIDHFHTAYVLESLLIWVERTQCIDSMNALKRGLAFHQAHLFDRNLWPRDKTRGRDTSFELRALAQSLKLYSYPQVLHLAGSHWQARLASMLLRLPQNPVGLFLDRYSKAGSPMSQTGYIRWTQAPAAKALSSFLVSNHDGGSRGQSHYPLCP